MKILQLKGCFCSFRSPHPVVPLARTSSPNLPIAGPTSPAFILKDTTVRTVFVAVFFFPSEERKGYAAPDVSCYQLVHFLSLRYEKATPCNGIRLDAGLTWTFKSIYIFFKTHHGQLVIIRIRPLFWFQCSNGLFLHDTGRILLRSVTFRWDQAYFNYSTTRNKSKLIAIHSLRQVPIYSEILALEA